MLAADLKKALESYSKADLVLMATELYRVIPKKERDAKELDAMISDFQAHQEKKKKAKTEPQVKPIGALESSSHAVPGIRLPAVLYGAEPICPQNRSPEVAFPGQRICQGTAANPTIRRTAKPQRNCWKSFYRMLGYASHYHLFPTSTPFKAVHIDQAKFFDIVVSRMLAQDNSAMGPACVPENDDGNTAGSIHLGPWKCPRSWLRG
jgi:hypothetical protein